MLKCTKNSKHIKMLPSQSIPAVWSFLSNSLSTVILQAW